MGAEGNINIYDTGKLKTIIPEPFGYHYHIFGIDVTVVYFGDSPPGYWSPPCLVCGDIDCERKEDRALVERAHIEALVDVWEVWT